MTFKPLPPRARTRTSRYSFSEASSSSSVHRRRSTFSPARTSYAGPSASSAESSSSFSNGQPSACWSRCSASSIFSGAYLPTQGFLHHFQIAAPHPDSFGCRDFFPVIITFLRQLPFIGQFLNLPFIRPVRHLPITSYLAYMTLTLTRATLTRLSSWIV